jgi:hypothetical protein
LNFVLVRSTCRSRKVIRKPNLDKSDTEYA